MRGWSAVVARQAAGLAVRIAAIFEETSQEDRRRTGVVQHVPAARSLLLAHLPAGERLVAGVERDVEIGIGRKAGRRGRLVLRAVADDGIAVALRDLARRGLQHCVQFGAVLRPGYAERLRGGRPADQVGSILAEHIELELAQRLGGVAAKQAVRGGRADIVALPGKAGLQALHQKPARAKAHRRRTFGVAEFGRPQGLVLLEDGEREPKLVEAIGVVEELLPRPEFGGDARRAAVALLAGHDDAAV